MKWEFVVGTCLSWVYFISKDDDDDVVVGIVVYGVVVVSADSDYT